MSRALILKGLIAVVVLQLLVLAAEYLNSVYPIWFGQEIRLKTVPVDPRSLFRGNYARLSYDISQVTLPEKKDREARMDEIIYVSLQKNADGIYEFSSASYEKPRTGIFIRGRLQDRRGFFASRLRINYGIEAYFAPKEKALRLERELRGSGVAVVMLASNGKAALIDVIPDKRRDN